MEVESLFWLIQIPFVDVFVFQVAVVTAEIIIATNNICLSNFSG